MHQLGVAIMRRTAFAIALLAAAVPAKAASIAIISFAGTTPIITIGGPIDLGDAAKFDGFAQALRPPVIVRLSSPGGSTMAALAIGRQIARLNYTTYVGDGEICASACGLIWLAGRSRWSGPQSHIGLHATYLTQNGVSVPASGGNALVGKYLGELGFRDDFVVYATSADPEQMAWLNKGVTDHFGVRWDLMEREVATVGTLQMEGKLPFSLAGRGQGPGATEGLPSPAPEPRLPQQLQPIPLVDPPPLTSPPTAQNYPRPPKPMPHPRLPKPIAQKTVLDILPDVFGLQAR